MKRTLAALVLFASASIASAGDILVTPDWLLAHQRDKNLVLLHVGAPADFEKEHIPGAMLANPGDLSIPRTEGALILQLLPPDQLKAKLEGYGISDDSRVVVYFAKDWVSPTTRVSFSLDAAGLGERTSILDGGMPAWKAAGGVVTAEASPARARGTITVKPHPELVADLAFVETHLKSPGVVIVDSRDTRFFDGADPGTMPRAGHIPGAKSLPFDRLVNDDNTMKSPADTAKTMEAAGIKPGDTVVSYCHIGQQATVLYVAAKRLGYKALLYDGSWDEWSRRPELPVETSLRAAPEGDDPFRWLEDVQGEKALAWVRQHDAKTTAVLEARPEYGPIYARTLQILDSKEKIPTPELLGETVYNFWRDDAHERGIWRRTPIASYRSTSPEWETVLDVDALAKSDGKAWVWKGADCLPPANVRCLVRLSPGGSDAAVVREFDTAVKQFVPGGFSLPEAKSRVAWRDADSLWVGTDFGPGTLTASGYPRFVKLWTRGTPLGEAKTVFACGPDDVAVSGSTDILSDGRYDLVTRTPAFFRQESFLVLGGRLVKIDVPEDARLRGFFRDRLLLSLRSDWTVGGKTYRAGSLLATPVGDLLRGVSRFDVLFDPGERVSLGQVERTKDHVLIQTLDNVRSRITALSLENGDWKRTDVPLPGLGTASLAATRDLGSFTSDLTNAYFFTYQDYASPTSLWLVEVGREPAKVKSMPAFFDATGMKTEQFEAVSKDGTKIPYFVVTPKGFKADGTAPTLLYGYGGFEQSEVPRYSGTIGSAWLARGGVYVDANIRGGGEFGPAWHKAAVKEKHIHNFEDFSAVARDLIARKITSPSHLGIMGGSQGGLLVSGTFVLYPEIFHAVVAQVPLADMRRYNKLLAGASWMAEYGDPDKPEDWAYIKTWSPYERLEKDAKYPTPFFWTNTKDDRVHPGHARKMVAKLESLGHPVYYFENTEGGHGSGAVNKQTAEVTALQYAYLWMMLR